MLRKFYMILLPVIAVAAFAVAPAIAQATAPQWYLCKAKTGGKFTNVACSKERTPRNFEKELVPDFEEATHVKIKNVSGTVAIVRATAGGFECKSITGKGIVWNEENVVNSELTGAGADDLKLTECKGTGGLATCTIRNPVAWKVSSELELEGTKIFDKYYPLIFKMDLTGTGCPGESEWTGSTRGEIASGGGKIEKFSGKTLKFLGEEAEFTAEIEQEGPAGAGVSSSNSGR